MEDNKWEKLEKILHEKVKLENEEMGVGIDPYTHVQESLYVKMKENLEIIKEIEALGFKVIYPAKISENDLKKLEENDISNKYTYALRCDTALIVDTELQHHSMELANKIGEHYFSLGKEYSSEYINDNVGIRINGLIEPQAEGFRAKHESEYEKILRKVGFVTRTLKIGNREHLKIYTDGQFLPVKRSIFSQVYAKIKDTIQIRKIANSVTEFIKSKVKKDYILSPNSPDFLMKNRKLLLKTLRQNPQYLDQVPENILLEELSQNQLPEDGIINTAFKNGYSFGRSNLCVCINEPIRKAIIQYINKKEKLNICDKKNIEYLLDESKIQEVDEKENLSNKNISQYLNFKEELLDLVIKKGYKIDEYSPKNLKEDARLAECYYRDLLEKNGDILGYNDILNSELLKNEEFLQKYINLLNQKGIDSKTIISSLIHNEECINTLKNNLGLFSLMLDSVSIENLKEFFNNFFTDEELNEILTNNKELQGKMLRISQLYAKDNSILESLNGKLLDERYQNIPNYKIQLIAKVPEVGSFDGCGIQSKILGFSDYEYILYEKMTKLVSTKTDKWNRFEQNIVNNLANGDYSELIAELYEQAKKGNKINIDDIETLTSLFSKEIYFNFNNNIFNITTKEELEHFEEIKEVVCDTILTNPNLDDKQLTSSISKYIKNFDQLPELDRIKLALLEKYYNMNLEEAMDIVSSFSSDIDNISVDNKYQTSIVEQIRAIKNIFECNDINILKQVAELNILVKTDLSSSTYLIEESKEMFEQLYKENLYMPKESEKIGNVTYNGKNIEVFDANTNFSMIVKRVGNKNANYQRLWNTISPNNQLRYYTCTSYMTDENLLNKDDGMVIFGFAQGTNKYSFNAIFSSDSHTPCIGGDVIYPPTGREQYTIPSTLEMNTRGGYNEIVINTLSVDTNGQMTKMQPDYIVYIKGQGEIVAENDHLWENSKKAASEFGIPIVIIDREKVKQSEKAKIGNMSEELINISQDSNKVLKFVQKVTHYIERYGEESISKFAPKEKIDTLRKYIEEQKKKERSDILIPNLESTIRPNDTRQAVLKRQDELKNKISLGEER